MKQITLFNLEAFESTPVLSPHHDPYWDEIKSVPEQPDTVLEQDTGEVLPVVEYLEKIGSDRRLVVLEQDTSNSVPEQKHTVPEHLQWVEKYSPSKRKDNHYYRYCYKLRGKIQHRHISGGNVRSPIAIARKAEIEMAIADGQTPQEIEKLIRSWREEKQ